MVCNWGMSDNLGMIEYGEGQGEVFLARDISSPRNYSEATAQQIDDEVRKLTDEAYSRRLDCSLSIGTSSRRLPKHCSNTRLLMAHMSRKSWSLVRSKTRRVLRLPRTSLKRQSPSSVLLMKRRKIAETIFPEN